MQTLLLILCLVLAVPASSAAQTVETYRFGLFAEAATVTDTSVPLWETTWAAKSATCNLADPGGTATPIVIAAGVHVAYSDPTVGGRYCVSPLVTPVVPACTTPTCPRYTGYLKAANSVGSAPWTVAVPLLTTTAVAQTPVDCAVSAWSAATWSAWSATSPTTETRTGTQTRTVVTPASGGGAVCPTLTQTTTETRPITVTPPPDACAPPFGTEAIAIFVTNWQFTSKKPGSKMRINYQIASKSPVTEIRAKLNGEFAQGDPAAGTGSGGLWFLQPGPGTYKLTVWAKNTVGCTREVFAPKSPLVITP